MNKQYLETVAVAVAVAVVGGVVDVFDVIYCIVQRRCISS